jgi:hypothetical protein
MQMIYIFYSTKLGIFGELICLISLFWRWIEALEKRSTQPLSKIGSPDFKEQFEQTLRRVTGKRFKTTLAAADLFRCETNVQGEDRFFVNLSWSAADSQAEEPDRHRTVIVVTRKHGTIAAKETGFSFAHCPVCYGPLTENDDAKYGFCDAVLGDPEKDWVICDIVASYNFDDDALSDEGLDFPRTSREGEMSAV